METIQITGLLKSARILRRVLKSWGDCLSNSWVKPSAGEKNTQRSKIMIVINEKTCLFVYFPVPAKYKMKKKKKLRDKYLDLAGELKMSLNIKMIVILIVISSFGTISKCLEGKLELLEIGRRIETIHTTALLRLARISRRIREAWGDLLSLRYQLKTISEYWCEKLARIQIIIIREMT